MRPLRSIVSLACVLAVMAFACVPVHAQLFPNAPWNKFNSTAAGGCPNGQCPNSPLMQTANQAGHWSYPGTIDNHLEGAHGVPTNGMSREQKLDLHDALHEGRAPAMKQAVHVATSAYSAPMASPVSSGGSTGSVKSGGSSGGMLRVGHPDSQGHIVTSIGSTIDPSIARAGAGQVETLAIGDRIKFRKVLLEAARQARDAGSISAMEYFALSAASRVPRVLDNMQAAVHEAAIEEGLATTQAIDWSSLIDFIERLIPIIIKLIDLFS